MEQPLGRKAIHIAAIPFLRLLKGPTEQTDLCHRERLYFGGHSLPRKDQWLLEWRNFRHRAVALRARIRIRRGLLGE